MRANGLGAGVVLLAWATAIGAADDFASGRAGSAGAIETTGSVAAVTVYRGQALVTREVDLPAERGLHELVVIELPEHVVPGSLHAESDNGAEVRSVRYRARPVQTDVREEVRELDRQIRAFGDNIEQLERERNTLQQQSAYLDKLEQFVAPTAQTELSRGVLNADTLATLTDAVFNHRGRIAERQLEIDHETRDLRERIDVLERERAKIAGRSSRTAREAVIFVNVTNPSGKLRLHYLVNQATWSPSYIARVGANRKQVQLEYYASIQQTSGEDWTDIAMRLSTATPSLVARAPSLEPMKVALHAPVQMGENVAVLNDRAELLRMQQQAESGRNDAYLGAANVADQFESRRGTQTAFGAVMPSQTLASADDELNYFAGNIQLLDLTETSRVRRSKAIQPEPTQGMTITYELGDRTSLPSRADAQMVQILALKLDAEFYRVATPVLTPHVYEEAAAKNAGAKPLLAGPISTYLAGEFVGHGALPTVTSGEPFTVGLGIDPSLRAARELVERKQEIQGGNRIVTITYRLALENFGAKPANVRLLDRLPTADESKIKVTLIDEGESMTKDPAFEESRKKGLLRWDMKLDGGAIGREATAVEYTFQLEYEKGMTVATLGA